MRILENKLFPSTEYSNNHRICQRTINFKMQLFKISLFFLLACSFSCGVKLVKSDTQPISHAIFDDLLQQYVSPEGSVNYKGFIRDSTQFNNYLALLKDNPPNKKNWSKDEQLAYWINVYNAFTVKLIIDHYPVKSIKDIKSGIGFVNSVWDIKFIKIGGMEYDLNNIEHGIIRKQFDEPRIHFAVNCASYSCPRLRNEAYVAEKLDAQLDDQTRLFLNDIRKNQISSSEKIKISSIFKWYSTDFTNKGIFSRLFGGSGRAKKLIDFINPYVKMDISRDAEVAFLEYKWNLNE